MQKQKRKKKPLRSRLHTRAKIKAHKLEDKSRRRLQESRRRLQVEERIMTLLYLNDNRRGELRSMAFSLGLKLADLPSKTNDPSGETICRLIAEAETL